MYSRPSKVLIMNLIFLLCLFAVPIAGNQEWYNVYREEVGESEYQPQREYQYRYDGQIVTGIPEESKQAAGTRLQAMVSLVLLQNEPTAILQIKHVRFGQANRDLPTPYEVQPFSIFEEKEMEEENLGLMKLPVRFKYVDGVVSELEFDREDKPWSENIKRAIINMLQMNMGKNARIDMTKEKLINLDKEISGERLETDDELFTVQERTIEGDCEVLYSLKKNPKEMQERGTMKITKSINFEKCKERLDIRYNHRFGEKEQEKENEMKELTTKSNTILTSRVMGNKQKFLIDRTELRSQYVFVPTNKQDTLLTTYVAGKLELIKVTRTTNDVDEPRSEKKETLLYNPKREIQIERFYMNGDEELTLSHPYSQVKHKFELIEHLIRSMVRNIQEKEHGTEPEMAQQMSRIVEILRMCSKEELSKVHREFCEDSGKFDKKTQDMVRDILVDALAIAGTKNTIDHLIRTIEERKVSVIKAAKALQVLMNTRVVSEKHIDAVLRLSKKEVCERHPLLKQASLLTAGAMINTLCREHYDRIAVDTTELKRCPRQLKEKYLDELTNLFHGAETRYEMILALKTLANAGLDISVFKIEKILKDRSQERIIRVQAIDALRRLRSVMPRKIQRILIPVFKDRSEAPEVRMSALVQILNTNPEQAVLDQIIETLFKEQNIQIQSFTYSLLNSLSKSKDPSQRKMAEDLHVVLRLVPDKKYNLAGSKNTRLPLYSENYKMGASVDYTKIVANESALPRQIALNLDTVLAGELRKYTAQFGLIQYNGQQLLEKLINIIEGKKMEDVIVRGKRATSSFRPTDLLRTLYEKLGVTSRRDRYSAAHGMMYLRFMDIDVAVVPMDEETMPDALRIIRNDKIDISSIERLLRQGYRFNTHFATFVYETVRRIPTTLGVPLIISGEMPMVVGIEGEIKVKLTPENTKQFTGLRAEIKMKPTITANHVVMMTTWNPVLTSGLKMLQTAQIQLPIDTTLDVNVNRKVELKMTVVVPERRMRLAALHTRLVTVTSGWLKETKVWVEPRQKTLYKNDHEKQLEMVNSEFGEKSLGIKFNLRGQYRRTPKGFTEYALMDLLSGENFIELYMEPTRNSPRKILAEVEVERSSDEQMDRLEMNSFYSDNDEEKRLSRDEEDENRESSNESGDESRRMRYELYDEKMNKERRERRTESSEEENENAHEYKQRRERHKMAEKERRSEFSDYVKTYSTEKTSKLRMRMKVRTIGAPVEKEANMEVKAMCDDKMHFCRLNVEARRSPIFENERREWTLRANVQSLYPRVAQTISELMKMKHREFHAKIEGEWGTEKKQRMNIKIQGEQDREQMHNLKVVENMLKQKEESTALDHMERILKATQLNQFKATVDYELDSTTKQYFEKLLNQLKATVSWNVKELSAENKEDRVYVKVTIDPNVYDRVNVVLETPLRKIELPNVYVPVEVAPFMMNIHPYELPTRSIQHLIKKIVLEKIAECRVSEMRVNTFDNVELKTPLSTCYTVLAKDCSSETPRFAILMKKLNMDSGEMKMKVIDEENVIEVELDDEQLTIKVNGRIVDDEEKLRAVGVIRKDQMVTVETEDVLVRFDGRKVMLKLSAAYKSRQCGLCGNYDEDEENELRKANNELTDDVEEFHRSFMKTDETCLPLKERPIKGGKYRKYELEEEEEGYSLNKKESISPVMRTKVIEYSDEICFSKKPVAMCPDGTYEKEDILLEMKVPFACIRRSQHDAVKLARRARTHIVDLLNYKPSFVDNVKVPKICMMY